MGGVFRLVGQNDFYSEYNVYLRNSAATGSLIAADSTFTNVVMTGDSIQNNIANVAAIYGGKLSNVYISDTKLINNTGAGPTVYISNSVKSFSCFRCVFWQNEAEIEGIVSIAQAENVILNDLSIENNNVTVGSMIMIKKSINTTLLSSFFENNYCTGLPCALSVQKSDIVIIKHFLKTIM